VLVKKNITQEAERYLRKVKKDLDITAMAQLSGISGRASIRVSIVRSN
jgi:hypothetical protein